MYAHVRCHVRHASFEFTMSLPMENTSTEPGRKIGHSCDIGWQVVWQKVGMGLTFREIASRLQIAAHRIFARFQNTREISPTCRRGKHSCQVYRNTDRDKYCPAHSHTHTKLAASLITRKVGGACNV